MIVITRHVDQSVASRIEYDNNGVIKTITNCAREVHPLLQWNCSVYIMDTIGTTNLSFVEG